ncbi:transporter substrate-binding domain-containing protein [Streptomyces sp. L7]
MQFKAVPSAQRIGILQSGQVDLVAHSMTITCERMQQVLFSSDYLDSGQRVLVTDTSPAKTLADLAGQKVCTARGTTSLTELQRAAPGGAAGDRLPTGPTASCCSSRARWPPSRPPTTSSPD